jgi:DNA polymerase I-like protein with 3'-5' exonuclease and polymerase domains
MSKWLSKFTQKTENYSSVSRLSVRDSVIFPENGENFYINQEKQIHPIKIIHQENKEDSFTERASECIDSSGAMRESSSLLNRWVKKRSEKNLMRQEKTPYICPLTKTHTHLSKADLVFPEKDEAPILASPNINHSDIKYKFITNLSKAREEIQRLASQGELIGLDLETTGLCPHEGHKARLLQLSSKDSPVLLIDLFQVGGLEALREQILTLKAVAHNAVFEMKFFKAAGIEMTLDCTLLAAHVLTGEMAKLSDLCNHHLGIQIDKTLQVSDWNQSILTEDQLRYAAADAQFTLLLFEKLMPLIQKQDSMQVYAVMKKAQQAVVLMEMKGMPFDVEAHKILLERIIHERDIHKETLAHRLEGINLNSSKQLGEWLTKILGGETSKNFLKWEKTPKGKLATGEKAFLKSRKLLSKEDQSLIIESFLPYKEKEKQISSFGESLLKFISKKTNCIHANFKMAGTITGRFSCSNPNLQQIPRDKEFRALFKAPNGRTFVIADYSQMELRVAAIVAKEDKLLEAYRQGKDTHAITAAMLLHKSPIDVTKQERQLAKAVNFGMLYGQGARGLKNYAENDYGVAMSEAEATAYRAAWFKAYPAIAFWQYKMNTKCRQELMVSTPLGRRRHFVLSQNGDTYSAMKAYNTPIQGGAAEVMLAALGKLPKLLSNLDAKPISVIHDEVIIESSLEDAPRALEALEEAMTLGMLDVFPDASTLGLVEATLADSWADKS